MKKETLKRKRAEKKAKKSETKLAIKKVERRTNGRKK
jgi:hypothetical protein